MLGLLEQIRVQTSDRNLILGDVALQNLQRYFDALTPQTPAGTRGLLLSKLGFEYHKLGHDRKAISMLSQSLAIALDIKKGLSPVVINDLRFRLAIAYLRLGEAENCCEKPSAQSCIYPLQGTAVHQKQEGSLQSAQMLVEFLQHEPKESPRYLGAIWLLNITYMTLGQFPEGVPEQFRLPETVAKSNASFPRFINIAAKKGLDTFSLAGGAIAEDFDNDGLFDIVTSSWDPHGQMHYFHNEGDGTFADHTQKANLTGLYGGLNMVQADYNNDGHIDILVLRGAWMMQFGQMPNSLLRNNGDGTFTDVTFEAGLGRVHYPTQVAGFADYDNDGDLDLYIGNEATGEAQYPCQLFRNNGDDTFTDVAAQAGVTNDSFTKGVSWGDYDGDRDPDLYVSNLGMPNKLYRNNGDGTFTDVAQQLNVAGPNMSFPVWFWDFNNDGAMDLFVSSYTGQIWNQAAYSLNQPMVDFELPGHYRGDSKGNFTNVAKEQGLTAPMLPMGANFGDIDSDGYLDMYLGTGYPDYASLMPNLMYHNQSGNGFTDVTIPGGFGHLQKGHGIAFADFDGDGDQDVFEEMGGWYRGDQYYDALYENPGFDNHWIEIRLVGVTSNHSAIGARIQIIIEQEGQTRNIYRHVNSGASFGCNPLTQNIGLGHAPAIKQIQIYWPTSNTTQRFDNVAVDQRIVIREDNTQGTLSDLP